MDPNPYESPKTPVETTGKAVKRGMGAVAIILLTPLAVAIAFGASCTAVSAYVNATFSSVEGPSVFAAWAWVISAWLVFLLPPLATLAGMLWWLVRATRRA